MEQNIRNCEDTEIDLSRYVQVFRKRKKTFLGVFLLVFVLGVACLLFSPKIYRISILLQPPVKGKALTGANDLESAESLKGLIINNAFNEELKKRLNLDSDRNYVQFKVEIPNKTNILQVSMDLEKSKKEFGAEALQKLVEIISETYAPQVEAENNEISNQKRQKEAAIANDKEKVNNLQDQINKITAREDQLFNEIETVNKNSAQILAKYRGLLENGIQPNGNIFILLLANLSQNNLSYSNQLNSQLSDLSIRKDSLNLEIKNINLQINELEMAVEKLTSDKIFVLNLRVLSAPKISQFPIRPDNKKILAASFVIGIMLGVLAVLLQEFWTNNLRS